MSPDAPSPPDAGIGLRLTATVTAVASAFFLMDFVVRGAALAPPRAMLGMLPMVPIALAHALALVASAWWPRPPRVAALVLTGVVLFVGMLVVAGGADAAAVQARSAWQGASFSAYRLGIGTLVAIQGAFGVVLIWSRRAAGALSQDDAAARPRRRQGPMRLRRHDDD
jgi:hypothetical protein